MIFFAFSHPDNAKRTNAVSVFPDPVHTWANNTNLDDDDDDDDVGRSGLFKYLFTFDLVFNNIISCHAYINGEGDWQISYNV